MKFDTTDNLTGGREDISVSCHLGCYENAAWVGTNTKKGVCLKTIIASLDSISSNAPIV